MSLPAPVDNTPLLIVMEDGELSTGVLTEEQEKDGWTPFHLAAFNNDVDKLREMVDYGSDVFKKTKIKRKTAFTIALEKRNADVLLYLAELSKCEEIATWFLKRKARPLTINVRDSNHWTALHYAAKNNVETAITMLVKNNADVYATNDLRNTPLHVAASYGNAEAVKYLIDHGCDVNVRGCLGTTALHQAADKNHEHIIKLLLQRGAKVDATSAFNQTPMHHSASRNNMGATKALLEAGGNPNRKDESGRTVLHWAARKGSSQHLKVLVEYPGIDINAKDQRGNTALHHAKQKKRVQSFQLLKDLAETDRMAINDDGKAPTDTKCCIS